MGNTHTFAAIAATALSLVCVHLGPASAQTINTRKEYYEGRWDWKGVLKATQDPNNVSRIQFNTPTQAVYCYNRTCRNVKITRQQAGGDLTFSFNGTDYLEFRPAGTTQLNGRFWLDMKPPARSPDATVVLVRKP